MSQSGQVTEPRARIDHHAALALVANYSRDVVSLHEPDGRIAYIAPSCKALFGFEPAELEGYEIGSVMLRTASGETSLREFSGLLHEAPAAPLLLNVRRKDGRMIWVETAVQALRDDAGGITQFVASSRDVSQRVAAEAALAESEAKFRNLVETSSDWIWETNKAGEFTYCSPQVKNILGYPAESMLGRTAFAFMPPDEAIRVGAICRDLALRRQPFTMIRNLNLANDGREVMLETSGLPVLDAAGRLLGYRGVDRDVTEKWRIEQALARSEERYRMLLDHAVDPISIVTLAGEVIEFNRAATRMLGYGREDLGALRFEDIAPAEEVARLRATFRDCVRTGAAECLDGVLRCKDGSLLPVDIRGTVVEFGAQKVVLAIVHDITERLLRERERIQREVAHRDLLLREVHHRIKNNLQGVAGILRQLANKRPELRESMAEVIAQVRSIAAVYGLQGGSALNCSLHAMLREVAGVTESLWNAKVKCVSAATCSEQNCVFVVTESEAVPLALVLNELLANGVKHGTAGDGPRIDCAIDCDDGVRISIRNRGALPAGFDFESEQGVGVGLRLVHSLLPRDGARLSWRQDRDEVVVDMALTPPVVARVDKTEKTR